MLPNVCFLDFEVFLITIEPKLNYRSRRSVFDSHVPASDFSVTGQ